MGKVAEAGSKPHGKDGLLSVQEFLDLVPINRERFYIHVRKGTIPSYRFGRKILLNYEECLEAMRRVEK